MLTPGTAEELARALAEASASKKSIALFGNSSKERMGGPVMAADVTISTSQLNRLLKYEPRDLTVSVEAGMRFRDLNAILAEHQQMIPLDPVFYENATVGGVVAANSSGPRRRLYGTVRDLVIGMTFATLEGKLVRAGGMVVKNVAGLDMGKLMIGSFGTLAAIAVVNFRLHPMPPATRTFVHEFEQPAEALASRDAVLKSQLQPCAIDLIKSGGRYKLLIQAGATPAVLDRYARELPSYRVLDSGEEQAAWTEIREFVPRFLSTHENGAILRVSCPLSEIGRVLEAMPSDAVARAGTGICYGGYPDARAIKRGDRLRRGVIEFAPQTIRESTELWPEPGSDFEIMKKVKDMFDPSGILNRGRMYGRI